MWRPRLFGVLLLGAVACSSSRQKYDAEVSVAYNEKEEESLKVEAVWLKPRGEFIHVLLKFTNWYAERVTVDREGVSLVFRDASAHLHRAAERETLQKGETRQALYVFKLRTALDARGTVVVAVRPLAAGGKRLPAATLELPVKP